MKGERKCPECGGSGEVGVLYVDYPSATLDGVTCPTCSGRGRCCELEVVEYMARLRGPMSQREASRALGWPHWTWGQIERGTFELAHVDLYRFEDHARGWSSVRAALQAVAS